MEEEESGGSKVSSGPTFIKKRTKPRGSASASTPSSARTSLLRSNEQDEGEDEAGRQQGEAAVQRTAGIGARGRLYKDRKPIKQRGPSAAGISFGDDAGEPAFELKKSALAQASRKAREETGYGALPSSLDQASIGGSSNGYSASALAALKASTPARRRVMEDGGDLDLAHQEMLDPSAQTDEHGLALARLKFGADFADNGVPSEAVVTAAKERRRRAAMGQDENGPSDDFISLRDTSRDQESEPHPESRLQREEDETGSGEEEFADFTGATERVALGQKAIKEAKAREREERREAMDLDNDSDDSGMEWEKAQMGRMEGLPTRKQREKREKSPFRPAQIPMTAPLPTLTSTSARLVARISDLNSSITSHRQVIDDAVRQLGQLEGDEERNKADLEVAADKEAWFREMEDFFLSLSKFLDDKMPRLVDVENDWRDSMARRTRREERERSATMTDEACLFFGVPAQSLLPRWKLATDTVTSGEDVEEDDRPEADGGPFSVVRETRRAAAEQTISSAPLAGEASLAVAQSDILRRLSQLLDDVKAPEFLDPAAQVDGKLHPSSLVVRFHQWRALYPAEYAQAWGGLTLAGIWDFWARKEICCWDIPKMGSRSLDDFQWHKELIRYAAAGSSGDGEEKEEEADPPTAAESLGGDDEVVSHVICNTLITRIIEVGEAGAFDPWSETDTKSMIDILEQITYVLERDNPRFQSLVSCFLHTFQVHIDALIDGMALPPVIPPPPFDPRAPPALLSFLGRVRQLFFNLMLLNRYIPSSERPFYLGIIDRLVGNLIWKLVSAAKDTGGGEIARQIVSRCDRANVLRADVLARLAAIISNTSQS